MAWLHVLFGLFFVPAESQVKSAQQLKMTVLLFLTLYLSCQNPIIKVIYFLPLRSVRLFKFFSMRVVTTENGDTSGTAIEFENFMR